ncbi:Acg family FMN-binding oxidoreductase [Piscinibacter sp. HJYY11]|uniref:Acg family FMN-binding oxidoreductase n=1 Tax=Piscinibacter sp. HJYY11 TaxID=2801333 RepID=UPI00191FB56F|nr:twin-arginine translocation pathway signal protein [Piscinibacter sp. HJYY11]MBL0730080.1 twin-arginine translocation pathway signal protein [Piscinibacter sp. HJYY11]
MQRRAFIALAGGGAILAASGCSSALPDTATAAWRDAARETDARRWAVAHALLAPHSHNLQSWRVDLRQPDEITLYCDLSRLLPETDPLSRQILMSQGTFLEVLEMALRERGLRPQTTLFPQGVFGPGKPDARPVARVRLTADAAVPRDRLFAQVLTRRTHRGAYEMRAPQAEALRAIEQAAQAFPVRVGFAGGSDATQLAQQREIARRAWRIELRTPRTLMESYGWLRIGPREIAAHRDGISLNQPMVRFADAVGLFDRKTAPPPGDANVERQIEGFDTLMAATPAFFWLVTPGNDRITQVNAGRAYVRAQLAATAQGLSMHPLSQALQEYPEMAEPYREIHSLLGATGGATVQMWTRLGHATAIEPAPRRGIDAHLVQA